MKKFFAILVIGLMGCSVMLPDHHAKWTGVREGRMMYEISCDHINDCVKDMNRTCREHPWKVSLQWQGTSEYHYMIECYR